SINHDDRAFFDGGFVHRERFGQITTAADGQGADTGLAVNEEAVLAIQGHQLLAASTGVMVVVIMNPPSVPDEAIARIAAGPGVKRLALNAEAVIGCAGGITPERQKWPTMRAEGKAAVRGHLHGEIPARIATQTVIGSAEELQGAAGTDLGSPVVII